MNKIGKISEANPTQQKHAVVGIPEIQKTWVEYGTPYLPLIFTIIGWWVVSRQNDKRERRKEIREQIKQFEQRIDAIIAATIQYYILDGKDAKCAELSTKMRYNISVLDPLRKRIELAGLNCDIVNETLAFKQAVTGDKFESASRKKLQANDPLLLEVANAGFELVDKFEKSYFSTFPASSFWSFLKK
jgi:isoleucyl-tRNA synthetase